MAAITVRVVGVLSGACAPVVRCDDREAMTRLVQRRGALACADEHP